MFTKLDVLEEVVFRNCLHTVAAKSFFFNPTNQKLVGFLDNLQKLAKSAFGNAAHPNNEQFIHDRMPPHPKESKNQAHLEKST